MSALLIPGSPGELVDKITILEIKAAKISEKVKQSNILYELGVLMKSYEENITVSVKLTDLKRELKKVNESLWDIEDDIRSCERRADFGSDFIKLARSVYFENDRRASLKKDINILLASKIIEEKSYADY